MMLSCVLLALYLVSRTGAIPYKKDYNIYYGIKEEINNDEFINKGFREEYDGQGGVDETTIDAKSGSPEEIDNDESKSKVMTEVEINEMLGYNEDEEKIEDDNKRSAGGTGVELWPKVNGRIHIPYEIHHKITAANREKILNFIEQMNSYIVCNENTWKPKTDSDKHYVKFVDGKGCSSYLGKTKKTYDSDSSYQPITLNSECITGNQGIVLHEMLHAMGFSHEQSRPDRDYYVKIYKENIYYGEASNFKRKKDALDQSLRIIYDYGSVMHYPRKAFSRNNKDTIVPLLKDVEIGQRNGMSPTDIAELNSVYQCQRIYETSNQISGKFITANGVGGTEFKLSSKKKDRFDCVAECIYLSGSNKDINGATFESATGYCWCEEGQIQQQISSEYTNIWFNWKSFGPAVNLPLIKCNYVNGDGAGGSEHKIGVRSTHQSCALDCDRLRLVDPNINGATYDASTKQCYCKTNMAKITSSSRYETCPFGFINPNQKASCTYVRADGTGGSEFSVGTKTSGSECIKECETRRKDNIVISGATFSPSSKKCYCEVGQTKQSISRTWENCWFGKKVPSSRGSCNPKAGDGTGGSEINVGKAKDIQDCATACMKLYVVDETINGATFEKRTGKCWCEKKQTGYSSSTRYTNCQFA